MYIGRQISNLSDRVKLDSITASATATYNLLLNTVAYVPSSAESLTVSLNGVIQAPQDSYTVSGSQITFASALTSSDSIDFILAERSITLQTPSSGSVNTEQLADSSVTLAKLSATGTKDATTFLRGDNTFATAGVDGISSSSSSTALNIDSAGHVTHPLTSAFLVSPTSNSATINADTTYTIIAGTEIIDRNADWNTSNGTFTAPVTGLYHLTISIQVQSYDHNNNYSAVFINTSNRRFTPWFLGGSQFDADGSFYITGSCIADMDANDTAQFQFRHDQGVSGQVFIGQEYTFLGGYLLG